jgi:hypothetical protein
MIARPDTRRWGFLDQLIEFKHLKLADLPGIDAKALATMPIEKLRARPEVAALRAEGETQLAVYRRGLEARYGEQLNLYTHAVVCIGLLRLVT